MKIKKSSDKKVKKIAKKMAKKRWVTSEQAFRMCEIPEHMTNFFGVTGLIQTINEDGETLYNLWDVFKVSQQFNSEDLNSNSEDDV